MPISACVKNSTTPTCPPQLPGCVNRGSLGPSRSGARHGPSPVRLRPCASAVLVLCAQRRIKFPRNAGDSRAYSHLDRAHDRPHPHGAESDLHDVRYCRVEGSSACPLSGHSRASARSCPPSRDLTGGSRPRPTPKATLKRTKEPSLAADAVSQRYVSVTYIHPAAKSSGPRALQSPLRQAAFIPVCWGRR